MKVKELIEKLEGFPAGTEVCVLGNDPDFDVGLFLDIEEVSRITDSSGRVIALVAAEA